MNNFAPSLSLSLSLFLFLFRPSLMRHAPLSLLLSIYLRNFDKHLVCCTVRYLVHNSFYKHNVLATAFLFVCHSLSLSLSPTYTYTNSPPRCTHNVGKQQNRKSNQLKLFLADQLVAPLSFSLPSTMTMTTTTTNKEKQHYSYSMGGRSPGLVVMGEDWCSRGREFESLHRTLDGHFSH